MGAIRNAKATSVSNDAHEWRAAGHQVFVAQLNVPATRTALGGGFSGGIPDLAVMIEAVEKQGWRLDQMSVGSDKPGRPEVFCVFRAHVWGQPAPGR